MGYFQLRQGAELTVECYVWLRCAKKEGGGVGAGHVKKSSTVVGRRFEGPQGNSNHHFGAP